MKLAQHYRAQFTARRGDRLGLCLAAALSLHAGVLLGGIALWSQTRPAQPLDEEPLPIDFVYIDVPDSDSAVETDRQASVDSTAAGDRNPSLQPDAGQPGTAETPGTAAEATSQAIVLPPTAVPAGSSRPAGWTTSDDQNKDLESEPASNKPEEPAEADAAPSLPLTGPRSADPLPTLQPASPMIPTDAEPVVPVAPSSQPPAASAAPSVALNLDANSVAAPLQPSAPDAQTPMQIGLGINGIANPNRTAPGTAGVDANRDDIWGPYTDRLHEKINQRWQQIAIDTSREARVRFVINRQGQLGDVEITRTSGSAIADQSAMQAVLSAAPFEPLPRESTEEALVVNFTFTYHVSLPAQP